VWDVAARSPTRLPVLPQDEAFTTCVGPLRGLADPTRVAVIPHLHCGPLDVLELARRLRIEQSLLSHHLRVLRDASLVEARREGKHVLYRVPDLIQRSVRDGDAIDLGCCQLSFAAPAAPAASPAPAAPAGAGTSRHRARAPARRRSTARA
jgi:ArsR family transcriptional regulator